MQHIEFPQKLFSEWRHFQQDLAGVRLAVLPRNRTVSYQPVRQLDGAVMPQAKPGRHGRDSGTNPLRQPLNGEQQLMLLRLDPVRSRGFLAEVQKLANPVSECRDLAVFV
jgi:hypothetical protein